MVKKGESDSFQEDSSRIRFQDLIIDLENKSVLKRNERLDLPALSFDLLVALCKANGDPVDPRNLGQILWPDRIVGPDTLKQRVSLLRRALGKTPEGIDYVVNDRSRGYRVSGRPEAVRQQTSWGVSRRKILLLSGITVFAAASLWFSYEQLSSPRTLTVLVRPLELLDDTSSSGAGFQNGLSMELASRIASLPLLEAIYEPESHRSVPHDAVLIGQVDRSDTRLRVNVTLTAAGTGEVIWGSVYDRAFEEIFDVQRDITLHISFMLHDQVDPDAAERLKTGPTDSYEAYALFVQALGMRASDSKASLHLLEEALDIDPSFAAAATLRDALMQ